MKKLISLTIIFTFLINNIAYSLGTAPGSHVPATRAAAISLAQKEFLKRDPGIDALNAHGPAYRGGFRGKQFLNEEGEVDLRYTTDFYSRTNDEDSPEGWSKNPILQKTDLVEAFTLFRDQIFGEDADQKIEIKRGYFYVDEGELPIEVITKDTNGKYTIILHEDFIDKWNQVREKDVRFKVNFGTETEPDFRTVSTAWGIFYRVARHVMADLRKEDKGPAHLSFDGEKIKEIDEDLANIAGGRYGVINEGIWGWFLTVNYGNSERANNNSFKRRFESILNAEGEHAQELKLYEEFPTLLKYPEKKKQAVAYAYAINYQAFRNKINLTEEPIKNDEAKVEKHLDAIKQGKFRELFRGTGENKPKELVDAGESADAADGLNALQKERRLKNKIIWRVLGISSFVGVTVFLMSIGTLPPLSTDSDLSYSSLYGAFLALMMIGMMVYEWAVLKHNNRIKAADVGGHANVGKKSEESRLEQWILYDLIVRSLLIVAVHLVLAAYIPSISLHGATPAGFIFTNMILEAFLNRYIRAGAFKGSGPDAGDSYKYTPLWDGSGNLLDFHGNSLAALAKAEPDLAERMVLFLKEEMRRDPAKAEEFQANWDAAFAQEGKSRHDVIVEILGNADTLPDEIKGSLTGLTKLLLDPFVEDDIERNAASVMENLMAKLEGFSAEETNLNAADHVTKKALLFNFSQETGHKVMFSLLNYMVFYIAYLIGAPHLDLSIFQLPVSIEAVLVAAVVSWPVSRLLMRKETGYKTEQHKPYSAASDHDTEETPRINISQETVNRVMGYITVFTVVSIAYSIGAPWIGPTTFKLPVSVETGLVAAWATLVLALCKKVLIERHGEIESEGSKPGPGAVGAADVGAASETKLGITVRTIDELAGTLKYMDPESSVIMRVDWNVPVENSKVANDNRMRKSLPTLKAAVTKLNSKYFFVMSHRGRPQGTGFNPEFSMAPVTARARKLIWEGEINAEVVQLPYVLEDVEAAINEAKEQCRNAKIIFVFENTRLYSREEADAFEGRMGLVLKINTILLEAGMFPIAYINDAFDASHRDETASMMEMAENFAPRQRAAGLVMQEDIQKLIEFESSVTGKLVAVFGGKKFDKYKNIAALADKVKASGGKIYLSGALAHPYLAWERGMKIDDSYMPAGEDVDMVKQAIADIKASGVDISPTVVPDRSRRIDSLEPGDGLIINGSTGVFGSVYGTKALIKGANAAAERGVSVFATGDAMNHALDMFGFETSLDELSDKIIRTTAGGAAQAALAQGVKNMPVIAALLKDEPDAASTAAADHVTKKPPLISQETLDKVRNYFAVFVFISIAHAKGTPWLGLTMTSLPILFESFLVAAWITAILAMYIETAGKPGLHGKKITLLNISRKTINKAAQYLIAFTVFSRVYAIVAPRFDLLITTLPVPVEAGLVTVAAASILGVIYELYKALINIICHVGTVFLGADPGTEETPSTDISERIRRVLKYFLGFTVSSTVFALGISNIPPLIIAFLFSINGVLIIVLSLTAQSTVQMVEDMFMSFDDIDEEPDSADESADRDRTALREELTRIGAVEPEPEPQDSSSTMRVLFFNERSDESEAPDPTMRVLLFNERSDEPEPEAPGPGLTAIDPESMAPGRFSAMVREFFDKKAGENEPEKPGSPAPPVIDPESMAPGWLAATNSAAIVGEFFHNLVAMLKKISYIILDKIALKNPKESSPLAAPADEKRAVATIWVDRETSVFTKWSVTIIEPTEEHIRRKAARLARSALKIQQAGGFPIIIEPKMRLDGVHNIAASYAATTLTQEIVYEELAKVGVRFGSLIFIPSMIRPVNEAETRADSETVGYATLKGLLKTVPAEVPAIMFSLDSPDDGEAMSNFFAIVQANARQTMFDAIRDEAVRELRAEDKPEMAKKVGALTEAPWPISCTFDRFGARLQKQTVALWNARRGLDTPTGGELTELPAVVALKIPLATKYRNILLGVVASIDLKLAVRMTRFLKEAMREDPAKEARFRARWTAALAIIVEIEGEDRLLGEMKGTFEDLAGRLLGPFGEDIARISKPLSEELSKGVYTEFSARLQKLGVDDPKNLAGLIMLAAEPSDPKNEAEPPPRTPDGRFDHKDGRSPEGALTIIEESPRIRELLQTQGFFTLWEYRAAYNELRVKLGFAKLPAYPNDNQGRKDLKALEERGILKITRSTGGKGYKYSLTPERQAALKEKIPTVISEYILKLWTEDTPELMRTLEAGELQEIWDTVNLLHETTINIYIPDKIDLTNDMDTAIKALHQRGVKLTITTYRAHRGEDYVEGLFGKIDDTKEADGTKRIIIVDTEISNAILTHFSDAEYEGANDEDAGEYFRNTRLLNIKIDIPADLPDDRRTIMQAQLIRRAILARLVDNTARSLPIEQQLEKSLEGAFDTDIDVQDFIESLIETEQTEHTSLTILARIHPFLSEKWAINLLKKLDWELRVMRQFWTYA